MGEVRAPVPGKWFVMLSIVLAMLVILVLAGSIVVYVAFPHRGKDVPHTPWVGDAMRKGVDRLPTLDDEQAREQRTR